MLVKNGKKMFATEYAANKIKDEACYEHVKSC